MTIYEKYKKLEACDLLIKAVSDIHNAYCEDDETKLDAAILEAKDITDKMGE